MTATAAPTFAMQPVTAEDTEALLVLNNAAVPHVNDLDAAAFCAIVDEAAVAVKAVDAAGGVAGFVLALAPGKRYASENYAWFCANMGDEGFLYVDRIVVDPTRRRSGAQRALYEHVFAEAERTGAPRVTCEVNVRPPNPVSMAFHESLGFQGVGEFEPYGGTKRVRLLARPIG
ncbi:GNAT family N-acetyltransferase [Caenispirillum salinarum]|uniref:GNAT family N-acetyltransferase n=1 Tax=Caenispirillum salinarum TaxID=859058 RepID=UPI00384D3538